MNHFLNKIFVTPRKLCMLIILHQILNVNAKEFFQLLQQIVSYKYIGNVTSLILTSLFFRGSSKGSFVFGDRILNKQRNHSPCVIWIGQLSTAIKYSRCLFSPSYWTYPSEYDTTICKVSATVNWLSIKFSD